MFGLPLLWRAGPFASGGKEGGGALAPLCWLFAHAVVVVGEGWVGPGGVKKAFWVSLPLETPSPPGTLQCQRQKRPCWPKGSEERGG